MALLAALLPFVVSRGAYGHGWITTPVSKNELAWNLKESFPPGGSFRYEPWSSANGNLYQSMSDAPGSSCGSELGVYEEGPATWQQWYRPVQGLAMPTLTPGTDVELSQRLTADHGGQAWMMVSCGNSIGEDTPWTYLERAASDRGHHFLPSNPLIYAWGRGESQASGGVLKVTFHVPSDFVCPAGQAVGRWLWKTGNSCIDSNNVGRKTETFDFNEYKLVAPNPLGVCSLPPETFISCFDFQVPSSGPAPSAPPTLPPTAMTPPPTAATPPPTGMTPPPTAVVNPQPTPTPTPAFLAPTPAPTTSTSPLVMSCTVTQGAYFGATVNRCLQVCNVLGLTTWPCGNGFPCSCEWTSNTCVATPDLNRGVRDADCAKCPNGYKWWPCNEAILCTGRCSPR